MNEDRQSQETLPEDKSFQEQLDQHVDLRLKSRFFIYFAISIIMISYVIFHIINDEVSPLYPFIGFIIGILIGIIVTRVQHISWDENSQKVISRLDTYGLVILICYGIFEFFRKSVVSYFIHGPVVISASFAILAGIMIGRVLGIRGKIKSVIEKNS